MTARRRRRHARKPWARLRKLSTRALRTLAGQGNTFAAAELRRRLDRITVVTYDVTDDPAARARAVDVIRGIIARTKGAA